jgi:hypothetical protein
MDYFASNMGENPADEQALDFIKWFLLRTAAPQTKEPTEEERGEMLEVLNDIDQYLHSGDGDWDLTFHPDPEVERAIQSIRALILGENK